MPARSKLIDPDNPPLSTERIMRMRPAAEVLPQKFLDAHRRRREAAISAKESPRPNKGGRPKVDTPKKAISIRLDTDLIDQLRRSGPGWQTRANDILRKAVLQPTEFATMSGTNAADGAASRVAPLPMSKETIEAVVEEVIGNKARDISAALISAFDEVLATTPQAPLASPRRSRR